ncbi:MAG: phosphodiesterase, partial [Turicibacter sp.]
NALPQDYNPMTVATLLNGMKDKIIAVRGNCDSEVDQMVLEFPIMGDYNVIPLKNRKVVASHGHIYDENKLPLSLVTGDIFIFGHIHLPVLKQLEGIYIINPGSASLPKEDNPNTYGILDDHQFKIKTFDGEVFKEMTLK